MGISEFHKSGCIVYSRNPHFSMLRPKRAGAGVVDRWQPPDWKPPPRSLDELPTTTIPGPLGKGMISGLCIARTGLKDKKGRVLNEVGLFLGQGRDDVARGDFLCMVKGVQVYGELLDDTHAMKISDTLFVVPLRRSDAHIWSSANEPEFGKVANAKFIAHYAGHEVRSDLSAKDSIIAVLALYAAEVIRAGDEIFAHYGSDYEGLRTYQPGEAAVLLKRDIPFEQYPSEIFGVSLPGDAIFRD
jgi:hypothetical protein